jgi:hypothetical protein
MDAAVLAEALDSGRHRRDVRDDHAVALTGANACSPILPLPAGRPSPSPASPCAGRTLGGPWAAGYPGRRP